MVRKKLIEVALPVDAINKCNHPPTLISNHRSQLTLDAGEGQTQHQPA